MISHRGERQVFVHQRDGERVPTHGGFGAEDQEHTHGETDQNRYDVERRPVADP